MAGRSIATLARLVEGTYVSPMAKTDTQAAWRYHNATKHSQESLLAGPRFLDMANRPIPYKIYSSLEPIPLPTDFPLSDVAALDAIATFKRRLKTASLVISCHPGWR